MLFSTIKPILKNENLRQDFIRDCVLVVENHVEAQKGFAGIAIKNAYKALNRVTPGATWQAVNFLVDDFAEQIDPYLEEFAQKNKSYSKLPEFLEHCAEAIADSFLLVTDSKARAFDSSTVLSLYNMLRPQAKKHVTKAVPDIGILLQKYLVTPTGIEPVSAT